MNLKRRNFGRTTTNLFWQVRKKVKFGENFWRNEFVLGELNEFIW